MPAILVELHLIVPVGFQLALFCFLLLQGIQTFGTIKTFHAYCGAAGLCLQMQYHEDGSECDGGWRDAYVRYYLQQKNQRLLLRRLRSGRDGARDIGMRQVKATYNKSSVVRKGGRCGGRCCCMDTLASVENVNPALFVRILVASVRSDFLCIALGLLA
jgi:hypothetical protein